MSQCCGKIPTNEDVEAIERSMGLGNQLQGDIGERIAAEVAVNQLNLIGENFDPSNNGFDGVFRDSSGKLVIVEAKLTTKGMGSLANTSHGRQGSPEWIRYNAELMCNPLSSQYSPDNAKIGAEILRVGPENVRFVVITTDPQTQRSTIHELSLSGPYKSGEDGMVGGKGEWKDGKVHYTDYKDGSHTSWDEKNGEVSGVHSTDHGTGDITNHPTDNRGNPI